MNLSAEDRKILESIKDIAGRVFEVKYSHHIYQDDLLLIVFTPSKELASIDCGLSIVLDTAYRSIALRYILSQPVPRNKRRDLFEALNDLNYKLTRVKIVLQHPDRKVEVRAELFLFKDPFSSHNFEMVLGRFLIAGSVFLQLIDRFLKGQANKHEILEGIDFLEKLGPQSSQSGPGDYPYPS